MHINFLTLIKTSLPIVFPTHCMQLLLPEMVHFLTMTLVHGSSHPTLYALLTLCEGVPNLRPANLLLLMALPLNLHNIVCETSHTLNPPTAMGTLIQERN